MNDEAATRPLTAEALGRIDHDAYWHEFLIGDRPPAWDDHCILLRAMHTAEAVAVAVAVLGAVIERVQAIQATTEGQYIPQQWLNGFNIALRDMKAALDALAREVAGG